MSAKIAITTLGCRANRSDADSLEYKLASATTCPDTVQVVLRRERAHELIALGRHLKKKFWQTQLGQTRPAVLEESGEEAWQKATTDNFIPLLLKRTPLERGRLVTVQLDKIERERMLATWQSQPMTKSA